MIGTRGARIVAVIGGHDQQIGGTKRRQQARELLVELLEVGREACHVVAVAVQRVEVDKVREDEAGWRVGEYRLDMPHPFRIARGVKRTAGSTSGEEIMN